MSYKAERHGEPNLVVQYGPVIHLIEVVIVLISLEATTAHGVLKKSWRFILGDVALMHLRKPELPPRPHEPVLCHDQSSQFSFDGLHPICSANHFNVGREQKTSLEIGRASCRERV